MDFDGKEGTVDGEKGCDIRPTAIETIDEDWRHNVSARKTLRLLA